MPECKVGMREEKITSVIEVPEYALIMSEEEATFLLNLCGALTNGGKYRVISDGICGALKEAGLKYTDSVLVTSGCLRDVG